MSAPILTEEKVEDRLLYAPPWARETAEADRPTLLPPLPRMPRGVGGPNIDPPAPRPTFEGDVDVMELRRKLSLDPEILPQPPFVQRPKVRPLPVTGISFAVFLAALVAYGVTLIPTAAPVANHAQGSETESVAQPATLVTQKSDLAANRLLEKRQTYANNPLPLQLALAGTSAGESVMVSGLSTGTRLSAGIPYGPTGWRLAAGDIGKAVAFPPKDFVGFMDAAVDLRSPRNALMDSRLVRLEWLAEPAASKSPSPSEKADKEPSWRPSLQLGADEVDMLLRRGRGLLQTGDIAAARLALRRAAEAGSVDAAETLARSYDPAVLRSLGVLGFSPDATQAQTWYERASSLRAKQPSQQADLPSPVQ